jgi:hypothetical protein
LRDYPKKTRDLLELAMKHFRALIATQHAFPDPGDADEWAQECYQEACKGKPRAPVFEEHFADMVSFSLRLVAALLIILGQITRRGSQIRSELHTLARVAEGAYKLDDSKITKAEVASKVKTLTTKDKFVYPVSPSPFFEDSAHLSQDPATMEGPYTHPVIASTIKKQFYLKKSGEGNSLPFYFDGGIPLPTIALAATAVRLYTPFVSHWLTCIQIHCVLDEFVTGELDKNEFSSRTYRPIYEGHLVKLRQLEKAAPVMIQQLRDEIHRHCR